MDPTSPDTVTFLNKEFDTIIVGAGLAGAASAWHLRRAGQSVLILDIGPKASGASGIGGGLANPMMARKGRPVWECRAALDALTSMGIETSPDAEEGGFALVRPARDGEQAASFKRQASDHPDLGLFIESDHVDPSLAWLNTEFGLLKVKRGASANLGDTVARWLSDVPTLEIAPDWTVVENERGVTLGTSLGSFVAARMLLCMGRGMLDHPLTRTLRIEGIKGQIIRVRRPDGLPDPLPAISSWAYIIDDGNDGLWVGSTFERDYDSLAPTQEAEQSLLERASKTIPSLQGAEVLESRVGVRVNVPGVRLPMVGPLQPGSNIWVLTGLGARGLMYSAWFGSRIPAFFKDPEAIPARCRVVHRGAES